MEVPDNNLLVIKSAEQVEAEEATVDAKKQIPAAALTGLAASIRGGFWEAKSARTDTLSNGLPSLDTRLDESRRQCLCLYDPETLSYIKQGGGSTDYDPLTIQKCIVFEAWARDILAPADDKPWSIEPTPLPEMAESLEAEIQEKAQQFYEDKISPQLKETGSDEAAEYIGEMVFSKAAEIRDRVDEERMIEARERAARMETRIYDQLIEGDFTRAFNDFIEYLSRTPLGVLKGPVCKTVRRIDRHMDPETQKMISTVKLKKSKHFYAPRTEDIYFSQGALSIEEGDVYEIVRFQASSLQQLIGSPGYQEKAINKVIAEYGPRGLKEWTNNREENNSPAGIPNQTNSSYNGEIDAVDYWGMKQGKDLKEFGVKDVEDDRFYQVHCMLVADDVIMAELNPDPMGRKPYSATSFEKQAGYIHGRGIPEKVRPAQRGANVTRRALIDNIAIAAGPQAMVITGALLNQEDITSVYRGKIWQLKERQYGKDTRAVTFFQPQMMTTELISSLEKFYNDADRDTGIPRYVQGDQAGASRGAAGTASGLSMLMNAASKGVKDVIRSIDEDVLCRIITMMYDLNMMDPDVPEEDKGDFIIRSKGALSMAIKEQLQKIRMDFMQMATQSDAIIDVIGKEGLADLLRVITKDLDMDRGLIPSDKEIQGGEEAKYRAQFEEIINTLFQQGMLDEMQREALLNPEAFMQQMEQGGFQMQQPQQPQGAVA